MRFGTSELIVILLIAIVVFGSKKIVTLGEDVGKAIKSFRKGMNEDNSANNATKETDIEEIEHKK